MKVNNYLSDAGLRVRMRERDKLIYESNEIQREVNRLQKLVAENAASILKTQDEIRDAMVERRLVLIAYGGVSARLDVDGDRPQSTSVSFGPVLVLTEQS